MEILTEVFNTKVFSLYSFYFRELSNGGGKRKMLGYVPIGLSVQLSFILLFGLLELDVTKQYVCIQFYVTNRQ